MLHLCELAARASLMLGDGDTEGAGELLAAICIIAEVAETQRLDARRLLAAEQRQAA